MAALITFLFGLAAAVALYQQSIPHIEPVALAPTPAPPRPFNRAHVLSLCDLSDDPSTYIGKEVLISATHIGFLSMGRFSVLSECEGKMYPVGASISLTDGNYLSEELLSRLGELISVHGEWADTVVGQVTIRGRVEAVGRQAPYGGDFHIVATDVGVQVNAPPSRR